jgi:hypothetical protein
MTLHKIDIFYDNAFLFMKHSQDFANLALFLPGYYPDLVVLLNAALSG